MNRQSIKQHANEIRFERTRCSAHLLRAVVTCPGSSRPSFGIKGLIVVALAAGEPFREEQDGAVAIEAILGALRNATVDRGIKRAVDACVERLIGGDVERSDGVGGS